LESEDPKTLERTIRACNTHDALIEVLELMIGALDKSWLEQHDAGAAILCGLPHDPERCTVCKVRGVLAKAKGEQT